MTNKNEKIGVLDRPITIERYTLVDSDYADKQTTWATLVTCWAAVDFPTTKYGEAIEGAVLVTQPINFTIRKPDETITEKDRVNYNGKYYDILYIREDGRNDRLVLNTQNVT